MTSTAFAANVPEEKARLGFKGVVLFESTPENLVWPNLITGTEQPAQPVLLVESTNYGALSAIRGRLVRITENGTALEKGSVDLFYRRQVSVWDGARIALPKLSANVLSPRGLMAVAVTLKPGWYQYQLDIWLGSSVRSSPDRSLHTIIGVTGDGKFSYVPSSGTFGIAEISQRYQREGLENSYRYILTGPGAFGREIDREAMGIEHYLLDPSTGTRYPIEGWETNDPREGFDKQIVGVVDVPFEVLATPTLVVAWEFTSRGRASMSYTMSNNPQPPILE